MATILIIEDDYDIRWGMAEVLREEGYQVATAADGREALSWLRDGNEAALILLDLIMPGMNGWEFRAEQLKDPRIASIPVMLISGSVEVDQEVLSLGSAGVLTKPLSLEQLFVAAERYCRA